MSEPFDFQVGDEVKFVFHTVRGTCETFAERRGKIHGIRGDVITVKYRGKLYGIWRRNCRPIGVPSVVSEIITKILDAAKD